MEKVTLKVPEGIYAKLKDAVLTTVYQGLPEGLRKNFDDFEIVKISIWAEVKSNFEAEVIKG